MNDPLRPLRHHGIRRSHFLPVIFAFVAGAAGGADAQEALFVRARGTEIVAPDGQRLMLRGINLGNWLVPEGYMFKFDGPASPRQIQRVITELIGPEAAEAFWGGMISLPVSRRTMVGASGAGVEHHPGSVPFQTASDGGVHKSLNVPSCNGEPLQENGCFTRHCSSSVPEGYEVIQTCVAAHVQDIRDARPSSDDVLRTLVQFVENSRFRNSRTNDGYIEALGLP